MALPPTIPTSFVPHPASASRQRFRLDFMGAFGFLCYLVFFVVVAVSVGVYIYGIKLTADKETKDAELTKAEQAIDRTAAQGFIRLHDRLTSSKTLLDNHVAFSIFFTSLEKLLPVTVRFASVQVSFGDNKEVKLSGSGTAKSFNALAVASARLSADGRIKDAIFSHITINKDNTVSFSLNATLNQSLVMYVKPTTPEPAVATTTATTTNRL